MVFARLRASACSTLCAGLAVATARISTSKRERASPRIAERASRCCILKFQRAPAVAIMCALITAIQPRCREWYYLSDDVQWTLTFARLTQDACRLGRSLIGPTPGAASIPLLALRTP